MLHSEVLIGVLHVRNSHSLTHTRSIYTVAYPEFQRGGCLRGGGGGEAEIIYIISGGGEGPFLVRYEKCVCVCGRGGRCSPLQVRYKKWGPLAHSKYVVVIFNN